ncbi:VOC family protein [Moellerella wisconsensis]|uniref:VOC family protein n=1 Tax=Moellerella wisconsensis TaxID=158849 RepID=A0A9Q8Q553_9GAMM|nr:VOC family protein [Moellerella wisconsensis]UNH25500.1 VOC family protein [Moellerella wisconsensis]UNH32137.1 VOC family protein [Moellerella wisconsensis]
MNVLNQIAQLADLAEDLPLFEQRLQQMAEILGISLADYPIDHISVRCHQLTTAHRWCEGLAQCAELISNKSINGRPIYLFELAQPLNIAGWPVSIIELPFPKDKVYPQESWEHVEAVIDVEPEQLIEQASALLPKPLPHNFSLKISQPKGDYERLPNPTLAVSDGKITLKYHPFSLKKIVESEG